MSLRISWSLSVPYRSGRTSPRLRTTRGGTGAGALARSSVELEPCDSVVSSRENHDDRFSPAVVGGADTWRASARSGRWRNGDEDDAVGESLESGAVLLRCGGLRRSSAACRSRCWSVGARFPASDGSSAACDAELERWRRTSRPRLDLREGAGLAGASPWSWDEPVPQWTCVVRVAEGDRAGASGGTAEAWAGGVEAGLCRETCDDDVEGPCDGPGPCSPMVGARDACDSCDPAETDRLRRAGLRRFRAEVKRSKRENSGPEGSSGRSGSSGGARGGGGG